MAYGPLVMKSNNWEISFGITEELTSRFQNEFIILSTESWDNPEK